MQWLVWAWSETAIGDAMLHPHDKLPNPHLKLRNNFLQQHLVSNHILKEANFPLIETQCCLLFLLALTLSTLELLCLKEALFLILCVNPFNEVNTHIWVGIVGVLFDTMLKRLHELVAFMPCWEYTSITGCTIWTWLDQFSWNRSRHFFA